MSLFGLALLGVVLGAVGSEILRATRPDLVNRIEGSAKSFVGSSDAPESSEEEPEKE
jgi:hypothetical protein